MSLEDFQNDVRMNRVSVLAHRLLEQELGDPKVVADLLEVGAVYVGRLRRQPPGFEAHVWSWGKTAEEFLRLGIREEGIVAWGSQTGHKDDQNMEVIRGLWVITDRDAGFLRARGLLPDIDQPDTQDAPEETP